MISALDSGITDKNIADRVGDNRERNREWNTNALGLSRGGGGDHSDSRW